MTDSRRFLDIMQAIAQADDPEDLAAAIHKALTPEVLAGTECPACFEPLSEDGGCWSCDWGPVPSGDAAVPS